MKREKPSSIGRTTWTAWRRSAMSQRPVPHSINSRLGDTKVEKYGQIPTMLVN